MKRIKGLTNTIIIFTIILSITAITCLFYFNKKYQIKKNKEETYLKISNNYSTDVKTVRIAKLYKKSEEEYIESGSISKDAIIELSPVDITYETKYFPVAQSDYYISYEDVTPASKKEKNIRHKKYVPFNKNIITSSPTNFYDANDNLVMTLNEEYTFPIIINDKEKYGIDYQDELFYIKKDNVVKTEDAKNTTEKTRTNIRTYLYHTVYQKDKETCTNMYVCHTIEQFDSHMKYIHDKGYLTLTMQELEMFLDGKIRVPKNTIVITLDDGRRLYNSVPIIEKYEINATFFVIASLKNNKLEDYLGKTTYANFESHTYDMHNNYRCAGGTQGSQLLCEKNDNIIKDLEKSREVLGGTSNYFAYPFYDYNNNLVNILKKLDFHLAFVGVADSDGYSTPKTDRMKIRRLTIWGNCSLNELKKDLPESE